MNVARVVFALALGMALAAGCDRRIEAFDPDEKVEQPDLSRIFPPGAERSAEDPAGGMASASAGRGAPPPGPSGAAEPIRGTIRVAEELADRIPSGAVLFLVARGAQPGPPVAVKRIASPRFPMDFEIGPGDRMIEAIPFEGPLELSARIDADHNAMTRNPGDLQGAAAGSVDPGASGVEIVIGEIL